MSSERMWRVRRLLCISRLLVRCSYLALRQRRDEIPHLLYTEFRELGGVYVKFLQLLVLQSELFQSLREYDLYDVYDQVTYDPINIHMLLNSELGISHDITLMSTEPFAAGSFGQVYFARYNNKDIVVKVLRPSVIKALPFDLMVLGWVSRLIDMVSPSAAINTTRLYKELAKTTRAETNYILEADYATTLHERYKTHPNIFIPYTFRNLSTKHIICQEYVDGVAATDLLRATKQGIDAKNYIYQTTGSDLHTQLVAFGTEILTSVFKHGATYGDPHPGNVKFMSDNKVGLIDYGIQAPAPKNITSFYKLIEQYYNLYHDQFNIQAYSQALLEMYGGDIVQAARSLDAYFASDLKIVDSMATMAEQMLSEQSSKTRYLLDNNKVLTLFGTVINKNNQFCLQYEMDGPELMRAANLCIGLVSELGMKKVVLKEIYEIVMQNIQDIDFNESTVLLHPETAFEILASWLDQVSYRNPQLHRSIMQGGMMHV